MLSVDQHSIFDLSSQFIIHLGSPLHPHTTKLAKTSDLSRYSPFNSLYICLSNILPCFARNLTERQSDTWQSSQKNSRPFN